MQFVDVFPFLTSFPSVCTACSQNELGCNLQKLIESLLVQSTPWGNLRLCCPFLQLFTVKKVFLPNLSVSILHCNDCHFFPNTDSRTINNGSSIFRSHVWLNLCFSPMIKMHQTEEWVIHKTSQQVLCDTKIDKIVFSTIICQWVFAIIQSSPYRQELSLKLIRYLVSDLTWEQSLLDENAIYCNFSFWQCNENLLQNFSKTAESIFPCYLVSRQLQPLFMLWWLDSCLGRITQITVRGITE